MSIIEKTEGSTKNISTPLESRRKSAFENVFVSLRYFDKQKSCEEFSK